MASLFIKDREANELAERLARERGMTKTAAVKLALEHELARVPKRRPTREILEELWAKHPPGPSTGLKADKAFYDDLSGDL